MSENKSLGRKIGNSTVYFFIFSENLKVVFKRTDVFMNTIFLYKVVNKIVFN